MIVLQTHEGSVKKAENARFIADLFLVVLNMAEYRELEPSNKIVIATDNTPAHSGVEGLACINIDADGITNGIMLVVLRLAPCSPILNPIEGWWNVLKAKMRRFMGTEKEVFLVRGGYDTFTAHQLALMKEAVEVSRHSLPQRLVWRRMERLRLMACFAAERGEDIVLGKMVASCLFALVGIGDGQI